MDSSPSDHSTDKVLENSRKQGTHPKLSELRGTKITMSSEDDGSVTEATQNLLEFAVTKGHTLHTVTHMSKTQLADFLRDFYGKMKAKSNDSFTVKDLRAGLHKFFLDEVNVDIVNDRAFDLANADFDISSRTSRKGQHKMLIETEDLKTIYLSKAMDTSKPESLQNKVFFDISLYICNRGKEYFRNMKKNDFDVSTDVYGRRYVWLKDNPSSRKDDLQKMKRNVDEESPVQRISERMYERPGDPRCPLASFLKYVTHLHPMTDVFWQRPKRNVSSKDYVWYDHAPLGSSTITKLMQRISLQAGLSDVYTNYSIRSSCIPLLEAVCEEALRTENNGSAASQSVNSTVDNNKLSGPVLSRSPMEEVSSDDGMSQTSDVQANHSDQDVKAPVQNREKPPGISVTSSVGSGSMDGDDGDIGLMQAKTQVLDLIRGLMVKDIQKFVDWLKTVRVQYSSGELIVLCSPVDKSNVEPNPDDAVLCRNGLTSYVDKNGITSYSSSHSHPFKKSGNFELSDKRVLQKRSSLNEDYGSRNDASEMVGTVIKQVEFNSMAGFHCSSEDFGPMKISIPRHDTLLVTEVPENLQVMLHKKVNPVGHSEPLPERVFYSENEMDVSDMLVNLNVNSHRPKPCIAVSSNTVASSSHSSYNSTSNSHDKHHLTVQQHHTGPVMVTIPAAHLSSSSAAKEHFRYYKNRSLGCLDQPSGLSEGIALKRVSSTGTPVLKRQANVMDTSMFPENLTTRHLQEDLQATNLSMKPLRLVESPEAKRARAERLADSLRVHQEILQNSPLIKRPGERNFSGFRHSYANALANSLKSESSFVKTESSFVKTESSFVKTEPQDTSYS